MEKTEKLFVRTEKVAWATEEIERKVSGIIDSKFIGGFMKSVSSY